MIVSVVSLVVFHSESRNLIYTVLVQSHAANVCAILALHACRFVGLAAFQNATCTHHTNASVAHVVFKVTDVELVYVLLLLIVNDHHVGADISICIVAAEANVE